MKNPALICLGLLVAAFATTDAAAGPVADGIKRIGKESGRAVFSEVERRVLEDYVAGRGDASDDDDDDDYDRERPGKKSKGKEKNKDKQKGKPGNASQGNPKGLPPGIRMKLARGGTLPPGIAKKNLPADVEGRLPPVAEGYERIVAAGKVLLVEKASGIIADVIDKTVRGSREAGAQNRGPFGQNYRAESPATADPGAGERALEAPPAPVDAEGSGKKWWQIWK